MKLAILEIGGTCVCTVFVTLISFLPIFKANTIVIP